MAVGRRRRSSRAPLVVGFLLALFCLAVAAAGVWFYYNEEGFIGAVFVGKLSSVYESKELDPLAVTGTMPGAPKRERSPGKDSFGYRITGNLEFAADGSGGRIGLQNPAFNQQMMAVEICVDDSPEVVYRSKFLAPNQYIEKIALSQPVSVGKHTGMAYIYAIDPKTERIMGVFEQPLSINIAPDASEEQPA